MGRVGISLPALFFYQLSLDEAATWRPLLAARYVQYYSFIQVNAYHSIHSVTCTFNLIIFPNMVEKCLSMVDN
jgi:hypothetical protein